MIPGLILTCAGILAAWRPVETHAWTAVVLATVFLAFVPWAWGKTSAEGVRNSVGVIVVWLTLVAAGQSGGVNRSEAISQIFLAGAVVITLWLASRQAPDGRVTDLFILGLITLSVWGLWQSLGGLDHLQGLTDTLPEHLRAVAAARIERGRAFASFLLPSHLAVVLATVMPMAMVRIKGTIEGILFAAAFAVGGLGLVMTRSPVGVALALASCGLVMGGRAQRSRLWWTIISGVAAIGLVAGFRPDVLRLEPIALRLDNWGSAVWVWTTAPFSGVGLGGFGLAAQAVPWPVGNHPVHAHSMPLEMLADLGPIGLAAWIFSAVWLVGLVRRVWITRPDIAAALLVIPVHNLVDFSLYTSAVALPWALLLGWAVALTRDHTREKTMASPRLRWISVLAAAVAVGLAVLVFAADVFVEAGSGDGPIDSRFDWAYRAATVAPWNADAVNLVGELSLQSGRREFVDISLKLLTARRWQQPCSAARAQLIGRLRRLGGDPVEGVAELWKAHNFQPYDDKRREDFESAAREMEGPPVGDR